MTSINRHCLTIGCTTAISSITVTSQLSGVTCGSPEWLSWTSQNPVHGIPLYPIDIKIPYCCFLSLYNRRGLFVRF